MLTLLMYSVFWFLSSDVCVPLNLHHKHLPTNYKLPELCARQKYINLIF
uniref:Uncharacterized protein n=1 Tax=Arundo donax TaxID=35708 RepID=A0A0A9ER38_ARUDO